MKKGVVAGLITVVILSIDQAQICSKPITIKTHVDNSSKVYISFENIRKEAVDTIILYRSFVDIDKMYALDLSYYPITKMQIPCKNFNGIIIDSMTAQNTTYYYYVKIQYTGGETVPLKVFVVTIPDIVPINSSPIVSFIIDKIHYFCEIRYGNSGLKRFPVNLGAKPWHRKTFYDCMSTPEGVYHIEYIKPVCSFHAALGVSYPNEQDRIRYTQALKQKKIPAQNGHVVSIGGSIQIHGGGIGNNWTWGCIAMRNDDLDWIFTLPQLKKGIPVIIVGNEFTRDSLLRNDTM